MNKLIAPDYILESSWEVCNKVGGIYTVLSTRAKTLQKDYADKLLFIGPDLWEGKENPLFTESDSLFKEWVNHAVNTENIKVRVGRWNVPGEPVAILVDFNQYYKIKNDIYTDCWNNFGVDSLHAYGDYDEASMFSYAAGKVVESYYNFYLKDIEDVRVIYQAHEWMTGLGALYIKKNVPEIATIFTTHATTIGRSIAGNNKPLYDYLFAYNGDQMAAELNVQSKHSIEKQTAHNVDCFTTVSDITDRECEELLDKKCDAVLMNGFENDFVPSSTKFVNNRKKSRAKLLEVAGKLLGQKFGDDTILMSIGGRYEFKNKGIDVFIETVARLNNNFDLKRDIIAFMLVPAWVGGPRQDLLDRLNSKEEFDTPLENPFITHWLHNFDSDATIGMTRYLNMSNSKDSRVKLIFVPCYLTGEDGIFNKSYYDLLLGMDLSVYPSYYEPWGYTPLESIAFKVPTITTDLAGFGLWAKTQNAGDSIESGVYVVHRSDYNYSEVVDKICEVVCSFSQLDEKKVSAARKAAGKLAGNALWKNFITYYYQAYDIALRKAKNRKQNTY